MTDALIPALMPASGLTGFQPCGSARNLAKHVVKDTLCEAPKGIPDYLRKYYWWTYIHPRAVKFFERQWLVSAILWGNYARLRDAALAKLGDALSGATLQVACAYGDLTTRLAQRTTAGNGTLDVVDVLPIQLQNLQSKLPPGGPVRLLAMNAEDLKLPDRSYDRVLIFFLLHEQPVAVRCRTLQEVFRVVKPGGQIVIVDYALPRRWHPARYLWRIVLAVLEPFALDLWHDDISAWMPGTCMRETGSQSFFGGLYRMTTFTRESKPRTRVCGQRGAHRCGS
jgi:ubiquinone/menaquinone biosynthesis C-methylase UbiE